MRHAIRFGRRALWLPGDKAWNPARSWRNPEADQSHWKTEGGLIRKLLAKITHGSSQAMKLILTGDTIPASEMERYGVVSCVAPMDSNVVEEAVKLARTIASYSVPVVGLAKQAVKAGE